MKIGDFVYCIRNYTHIVSRCNQGRGIFFEEGKEYKVVDINVHNGNITILGKVHFEFERWIYDNYFCASKQELRKLKLNKLNGTKAPKER